MKENLSATIGKLTKDSAIVSAALLDYIPDSISSDNMLVVSSDLSDFVVSSDVSSIVTDVFPATYAWDIVSEDEEGRNITIGVESYIDQSSSYTNSVTPYANGTKIGEPKDVKTIEVGTVLEWNPDIDESPFYIKATCIEVVAKNKLGLATYDELSTGFHEISSDINAISGAIDQKIYIEDRLSGQTVSAYSDLSVIKLDSAQYAELLTTSALISNCIYVVEDNYIDAYGREIKNVKYPLSTELSNAATVGYVNDSINSLSIDGYVKKS